SDGIWLHERCEGDWRAAHSQLDEEEAHQPATGKQPDAAADVPDRAEVRPAADPVPSHRQPAETAQTPAPVTEQDCAVCGGDLYRCFPLRCPLKSVPNSLARNKEEERLH